MKELIYGDKIIRMEGVIVEIHDGCVGIDLKGRLGYLTIPMRMLITDYPLAVGCMEHEFCGAARGRDKREVRE